MTQTVNRRKVWGTVLLVWPIAALFLTGILQAAASQIPDISGGMELFGTTSAISSAISILAYGLAALATLFGLPSVIVGIVLLATHPRPDEVSAAQPANEAAQSIQSLRPVVQEKNGVATAGMILGICAVVLILIPFIGLIVGILAIIFSSLGLKKEAERGRGLAGLIMGIAGTLIGLVVSATVFLLISYAFQMSY